MGIIQMYSCKLYTCIVANGSERRHNVPCKFAYFSFFKEMKVKTAKLLSIVLATTLACSTPALSNTRCASWDAANGDGVTTSLAGTSWSYTYSGATGQLIFNASNTGTNVYPNGQRLDFVWAEHGGEFWLTVPEGSTGTSPYLYTIQYGSRDSKCGGGQIISTGPGQTSVQPSGFWMALEQ